MANVIVVVRKSLLSHSDVPPRAAAAGAIILSVQRQSRGQRKRQRLSGGASVEFRVHVQGKSSHLVGRCAVYAGDAVIFFRVDRRDGEGIFEEDGIGHCGRITGRPVGQEDVFSERG